MKKLIVFFMGICFMFAMEVQPEFRGNKLGISFDKLNETGEQVYAEDTHYSYASEWNGYTVYSIYGFYKDKLYTAGYLISDGDAMKEMGEQLVNTYGDSKKISETVYAWYSKDKKTMLRVEFIYDDEDGGYMTVSVIDVLTNKQILAEERKSKEKKL